MPGSLLNLVPAANFTRLLATSTSGGSVSLSPPGIIRKFSGAFSVEATAAVTTAGAGTQGVVAQLVSSISGAVGPALTFWGASAVVRYNWTDFAPIGVGNGVTYSLVLSPISSSNTVAVASGAGAIVVRELPGPQATNATSPVFSPSQLSPALWLDFSNSSTITLNSGNVASVTDLSGNGVTFSQANTGRQPPIAASGISGRQSLQGTGVSLQGLTSTKTMAAILPTATAAELVVVGQLNADGVSDPFGVSWGTGDSGDYFEFTDGNTYSGVCANARSTGNAVGSGVMTKPFVWGSQSTAGLFSILVNWGVNFTTATNTFTTGASSPTVLNASGNSMAGYQGELILLPYIMTTAQRSSLRGYLTAKWGTP